MMISRARGGPRIDARSRRWPRSCVSPRSLGGGGPHEIRRGSRAAVGSARLGRRGGAAEMASLGDIRRRARGPQLRGALGFIPGSCRAPCRAEVSARARERVRPPHRALVRGGQAWGLIRGGRCVSWHYLPEGAAESWGVSSSGGAQLGLASLMDTPGRSSSPACATGASIASISGTTFAPLTAPKTARGDPGAPMSSLEGFPARISAPREPEPGSPGADRVSGSTWPGSFARYDLNTRSWRTLPCSQSGGSASSSVTWPRWGSMRNGVCFPRKMSAPPTSENAFGFLLPTPTATKGLWPTPTVGDSKSSGNRNLEGSKAHAGTSLTDAVSGGQGIARGKLNPSWVEWLMGWPVGWTALEPLVMARSHNAPRLPGECSGSA